MKFLSLLISSCSFLILCKALKYENFTSEVLNRNKRFLVFPPTTSASILKYVGGYLGPIDIPSWQNINCLRNFQFQYNLPATWYTSFPTFPGLWRGRSNDGDSKTKEVKIRPDSSRKIAYELLEEMLNKEKKNGHECILRTICEVAETPLSHNGMIGELLQIFFTPGEHEIIDEEYRHAMKAGLHRVNCEKLYPECPFSILDTFSIVQNFHFDNVLNF
ncbi:hypothetical protein PVAND_006712 [Polypedilum vanderplanki]|uniref:Uncharacterized protein n=1 Tax=Polypedilum vanderplanki TaxID=319348 RepID=A0A9J6C4T5_POLVA|nr:hypothetical protein PVAND_006712 [Polypedilum vanderplanki]